jgi:hypothetical protein
VERRYSLMLGAIADCSVASFFWALAYSDDRWLYDGIAIGRKVCCRAVIEDVGMVVSALQSREMLSFGSSEPVPSNRLLTKEGAPVEVGARAFDILIAPLSRPNEIISKRHSFAQVWPAHRRW